MPILLLCSRRRCRARLAAAGDPCDHRALGVAVDAGYTNFDGEPVSVNDAGQGVMRVSG